MEYRINPHVALSETGLVLNPITGSSFSLNPIGQEILILLKEHKNLQEIKAILLEKYSAEDLGLENDLNYFILELKEFQLIGEIR